MQKILCLVLLTLLWLALNADFSVGNILLGAAVAFLVLSVTGWPKGRWWPRALWRWFCLAVVFMRELLLANLQVAVQILRPRLALQPCLVAVPLPPLNDAELVLLANMVTLTPGTLTLDIAVEKNQLFVHALHCADIDKLRADITDVFVKRIVAARGAER